MQQLAIDIPSVAHTHSGLTVSGLEELLREISKPLLPLEKAGVLVALIIKMMAERLTTVKVGAMSMEAILFLPEFLELCLRPQGADDDHKPKKATNETRRSETGSGHDVSHEQTFTRRFARVLPKAICQSLTVVRDVPQLELSQVPWMSNLLENYLGDSKRQAGCLRDTQGADGRNEASRPATEGLLKTLSDHR